MTSIKTVASHAGVSIATVSRVLNGTKYVSPDVREKVLEAVQTLGYQPSVPARNLRQQQTQSIGVLLPQLNDFFFSNLAFAIEKRLFDVGYSPIFCSTENSPEKEATFVELLIRHRVAGALVVPSLPVTAAIENIQVMTSRGIPIVVIDRPIPALPVSQVLSNNVQGGWEAARHLLGLGHRKIGVLASVFLGEESIDRQGPGNERIDGVRQAYAEAGIPFDPALVLTDKLPSIDMGYFGTLDLLRRARDVTAIFAISDEVAMGVLRAAYELNLNVPRDLSVIGFDDVPLASRVVPRLTTIAQPIDALADTAAELLMREIVEPDAGVQTVILDTHLIERESVTVPREMDKS